MYCSPVQALCSKMQILIFLFVSCLFPTLQEELGPTTSGLPSLITDPCLIELQKILPGRANHSSVV